MGQEKEKAKDGKAKAVTKLFPLLLLRCCWCGAVCKIPVKKKCAFEPDLIQDAKDKAKGKGKGSAGGEKSAA